MTPEEQVGIAEAGKHFYEQQIANLAREGANAAMLAESFAQQLKAANEKLKTLEPKPELKAVE